MILSGSDPIQLPVLAAVASPSSDADDPAEPLTSVDDDCLIRRHWTAVLRVPGKIDRPGSDVTAATAASTAPARALAPPILCARHEHARRLSRRVRSPG